MPTPVVLCLLAAVPLVAHWRSHHEWRAVYDFGQGPYVGEAVLRSDPRSVGRSVHVIVEIDGKRFDVWAYGSTAFRLRGWHYGEVVDVGGERQSLGAANARRRHVRHVVGRFAAQWMTPSGRGSLARAAPLVIAAHRVRTTLGHGARTLAPADGALFAGLVYGDDTGQSAAMTGRFRSSGLAHLTAVSGQNVAYVMAMVMPVLGRLRRPLRLVVTFVVLAWFTVLTRQEPSVIRAVLMAAIAASLFAGGRQTSGWQILGAAVTLGAVVDPFLVWSVGWWLSISGTAGLLMMTPALAATVRAWSSRSGGVPEWLVQWVVPMCAAQVGVLPVSIMIFGVPNALAIPCNLLATPVAGLVMLAGVPLAVVAGLAPIRVARLIMWPLGIAVRWVDTVAALGSRLRPPPVVDRFVAMTVLAVGVGAMWFHWRRVPT